MKGDCVTGEGAGSQPGLLWSLYIHNNNIESPISDNARGNLSVMNSD